MILGAWSTIIQLVGQFNIYTVLHGLWTLESRLFGLYPKKIIKENDFLTTLFFLYSFIMEKDCVTCICHANFIQVIIT